MRRRTAADKDGRSFATAAAAAADDGLQLGGVAAEIGSNYCALQVAIHMAILARRKDDWSLLFHLSWSLSYLSL